MRKALVSALSASVISLGLVGVTATPALAANAVACNQDGFMRIYNSDAVHCFANAGYLDVYITNVNFVFAGNNRVMVRYNDRGGWGSVTLDRWDSQGFWDHPVTVEDITIY
ncbi:hypothetical protein LDL08_20340 [Nonomuraea glycinis]|uniref:Streptomyces killer toxin-like beta/gamma crystallin domain-containing protein n=1 Tax=Nonomuraea glycinis TaxID=2047744 RepID=A0A918AAY6_9ACTN|nr:beta/gamma crystallin domain-containing protein [Nonomuraea glycinis]MCA2178540.1 hypothetical protein [Nonomuraea glycinis]GGP14006.1 hypothetical protein GCM10012278_68060 [Nonomuraea glycinis]